jgi:hypothetical protein
MAKIFDCSIWPAKDLWRHNGQRTGLILQRNCRRLNRKSSFCPSQGCQIFKPKNTNLGKFWRELKGKMLAYFTAIWYILRRLDICCGHLVYFVVIWYTFSPFWYLCCTKKNLATLVRVSKITISSKCAPKPIILANFCMRDLSLGVSATSLMDNVCKRCFRFLISLGVL